MKASAPLKVGLLTIISTCILIFGIMWLKGRSISIGDKLEVQFKDVDGMRPGSAVQMMGLRIGQVDEIIPVISDEDSYIIVKFVINEPNVTIPPASRISIQQSGIIGEKFLEVTPPMPQNILVYPRQGIKHNLRVNAPVEILSENKYFEIGKIKNIEIMKKNSVKLYKISYLITKPGIEIPMNSTVRITKTAYGEALRVIPPRGTEIKMPDPSTRYTVVEPLRMKEFLDVQIEAAVALKETNDKINELFTDEFMDDVRYTVENTKEVSEKAAVIIEQVAVILDSSKEDVKQLLASSAQLTDNMTKLSSNINKIVEDTRFRENLIETTASIRTTSEELSKLLKNSKIQDSLLNINATTKDMSEITQYINDLTKDEKFNHKIEETVVNLNELMVKLTKISDSVEDLTVDEKQNLKQIIQNSNEASEDLKKFSKKLNKRFLLLRLLL